jgi:plastocyanin
MSLVAIALVVACSSSSDGGSSGTTAEAGAAETGASDGGGAADAADAAVAIVNACKTFTDKTAATDPRTITWSFPISNDDRCWMIKVGESVTWMGDFTMHPLMVQDGDVPNPIANYDSTTGKVTFSAKGTFGFVCGNHPQMTGAIMVVE